MATKTTYYITLFIAFLALKLDCSSCSKTWMRSGYWYWGNEFPSSDINSALFTHLICAFAEVNSSNYHLSSNEQEQYFSSFTDTVKKQNPSIVTLLSIGGGNANSTVLSSMVSQSSYRQSFIESSIKIARLYGFQGLDFSWVSPTTTSDMSNMGTLLDEWRAAIDSESSNKSQLILTMAVSYSPGSLPVESIRRNLNWVHVMAYDYYMPSNSNYTGAHAALYDPLSNLNTDFGIRAWLASGLLASQIVMGLPYYGYAWKLVDPNNTNDYALGAPAAGPAITPDGSLSYQAIKEYINQHGATSLYNASYVVNYCKIGSIWIAFDDVEAITTKVSYAKKKRLLGYSVWQVPDDNNWVLSQAAQGALEVHHSNERRLLLTILLPIAMVIFLLGFMIWYLRRRLLKSKGMMAKEEEFLFKQGGNQEAAENLNSNSSDHLQDFNFAKIVAATNNFSIENKLGEGGYGPVYKGELPNGQEIAVKRLSKTSKQGLAEFKNEVSLTAKLQHINLVRLLGFCNQREEKMLIYEYMPNKSLDSYLFDLGRRLVLDWKKRVQIIEGVTQGLLYLQEYSRLTILHRDLKASNILLDNEMRPKISDLGMARIFEKDERETNSLRIVGTYGYVPPECVKEGVYSTKSDVYSFGVLLLQIISGKKNSYLYGLNENLNLLDYAYELWKDGRGMEFIDPSLDDASSSCKLLTCMQVALLCVQEKPADRPSMLEVSSMLKNETAAIAVPKKPAFSTIKEEDEGTNSTLHHEICSVNDATMSQILPR